MSLFISYSFFLSVHSLFSLFLSLSLSRSLLLLSFPTFSLYPFFSLLSLPLLSLSSLPFLSLLSVSSFLSLCCVSLYFFSRFDDYSPNFLIHYPRPSTHFRTSVVTPSCSRFYSQTIPRWSNPVHLRRPPEGEKSTKMADQGQPILLCDISKYGDLSLTSNKFLAPLFVWLLKWRGKNPQLTSQIIIYVVWPWLLYLWLYFSLSNLINTAILLLLMLLEFYEAFAITKLHYYSIFREMPRWFIVIIQ